METKKKEKGRKKGKDPTRGSDTHLTEARSLEKKRPDQGRTEGHSAHHVRAPLAEKCILFNIDR